MEGKLVKIKSFKKEIFPYTQKPILTNTEKKFYKALETALEDKFFIFPQMALNRFLQRADHIKEEDWYPHFNLIGNRTVDFTICSKEDFSLLLIIELDDSSHETKEKGKRDEFINITLTKTGYNITRIKKQSFYNPKELKERIYEHFEDLKNKEVIDVKEQINDTAVIEVHENQESYNTIPKCKTPQCNKEEMKIKITKKEKKLWVCPKCKASTYLQANT